MTTIKKQAVKDSQHADSEVRATISRERRMSSRCLSKRRGVGVERGGVQVKNEKADKINTSAEMLNK